MAERLKAEPAGGAGQTTDPQAELGYTGEPGVRPLTPEQVKALREGGADRHAGLVKPGVA